MSLSANKWWYGGVGGVIVAGVLSVVFFYDSGSRLVPAVEKSTGVAIEIEGLKYSNYKDEKLQSRVQAAQLMVVPRKIGVFQIQSINEAVISQFRLEIFNSPPTIPGNQEKLNSAPSVARENEFADELSEGIKGLASIKGAGRITKVTITGMEIFSLREDKPEFILQARVGSFDARKKELQLEQVTLLQPITGMRIVTERAVWNKKIKAFEIPGDYEVTTEKGVKKGKRIYIDMNFRLIYDKHSIKPK